MNTMQDHPTSTTTSMSTSAAATSMRAIVQHRYGDVDVLELATVERPSVGADEVLIEVHAAGVDRGTWHLMTGLPYLVRLAGFGITRPKQAVPGLDVAGRVVAVGAEVTRFAAGDEVFGIAKGSFAEYAVAAEAKLAHKPSSLSFEQAGVAAVSGISALQALTDVGGLEAGQRVLIIGASGGVGSYAVQLAKALGAHVTGVAGTRNLDLVRSLGADAVIDYSQEDFADSEERYDLIVDTGGRNRVARLRSVLAPDGVLVIVGGEGGNRVTGGFGRQLRAAARSPFTSQRLTALMTKEEGGSVDALAAYLESGAVVPAIGRRFTLEDAPEAIRQLAAGETSGKSVIVVRGSSR